MPIDKDAIEELHRLRAELDFARNVMSDLLKQIGLRERCGQCGRDTFWVPATHGAALLVNLDGTEHWPRCSRTARPALRETSVGGAA